MVSGIGTDFFLSDGNRMYGQQVSSQKMCIRDRVITGALTVPIQVPNPNNIAIRYRKG